MTAIHPNVIEAAKAVHAAFGEYMVARWAYRETDALYRAYRRAWHDLIIRALACVEEVE